MPLRQTYIVFQAILGTYDLFYVYFAGFKFKCTCAFLAYARLYLSRIDSFGFYDNLPLLEGLPNMLRFLTTFFLGVVEQAWYSWAAASSGYFVFQTAEQVDRTVIVSGSDPDGLISRSYGRITGRF